MKNLSAETIHRFLQINRHLRRYHHQMGEHGVHPRTLSILRFLMESGPATVGEVQAYLYRSPSTTSAVIAKLEEKGYVTRTRSKQDNRVVIVELTSIGEDIAQNTPLGGIPLLRQQLDTLPDSELHLLNDALSKLMALMEVTDTE